MEKLPILKPGEKAVWNDTVRKVNEIIDYLNAKESLYQPPIGSTEDLGEKEEDVDWTCNSCGQVIKDFKVGLAHALGHCHTKVEESCLITDGDGGKCGYLCHLGKFYSKAQCPCTKDKHRKHEVEEKEEMVTVATFENGNSNGKNRGVYNKEKLLKALESIK